MPCTLDRWGVRELLSWKFKDNALQIDSKLETEVEIRRSYLSSNIELDGIPRQKIRERVRKAKDNAENNFIFRWHINDFYGMNFNILHPLNLIIFELNIYSLPSNGIPLHQCLNCFLDFIIGFRLRKSCIFNVWS